MEILHEFILDLLGRDTPAAKIYEAKSEGDFHYIKVVYLQLKIFICILLFCVHTFFVYFAVLKVYTKGLAWQHAYLMACIAQILIEIFLFETLETIWIDFLVPSFVSCEVRLAF